MKKDCVYTRKSLRKYLHGHLFKLEQVRIERHLRSCVVCYSEYQALKQADETRQFLKDITPPEGMVQRMKEGISGLARIKKVLYRPLWIAGIILVIVAVYSYVARHRQVDVELESMVKAVPSAATAPAVTSSSAAMVSAPAATLPAAVARPVVSPLPAMAPLVVAITIAQENEKTAMRRINELMRGHGRQFSDEVREISGSLTAEELLTFFNRLGETGKVSYSRKRIDSFPSAQPIPFIMKLKEELKAAEKPVLPTSSVQKPAEKPAEAAVSAPPATSPTTSSAR